VRLKKLAVRIKLIIFVTGMVNAILNLVASAKKDSKEKIVKKWVATVDNQA